MVGICGLLLEFSRPRVWLPGAVGGACAILALFGLQLLLFSGVAMALVVFGTVLLVVEGVRPSFGLAGLVGAAVFIVGAERLIDLSAPGFGLPLWGVACMGGVAAVAILVIARSAARERRRLKAVGVSALVGSTGELMEYANGTGWAQIQGDYWPVTGTGDLYAGRRVRVSGMQGAALTVAPDSQDALPTRP
jgi:membrane-bound serine protease (ClpP class)